MSEKYETMNYWQAAYFLMCSMFNTNSFNALFLNLNRFD